MKRKNNATPIAVINKIARYLNKISKHCSTSAIILAGGKSVRMDNVSKQLIDICGKPKKLLTLSSFLRYKVPAGLPLTLHLSKSSCLFYL